MRTKQPKSDDLHWKEDGQPKGAPVGFCERRWNRSLAFGQGGAKTAEARVSSPNC